MGTYGGELRGEPCRRLAPRQLEILDHIANGKTCSQIAKAMGISVSTVRNTRHMIRMKLGLSSDVDLLRYALDHCELEKK